MGTASPVTLFQSHSCNVSPCTSFCLSLCSTFGEVLHVQRASRHSRALSDLVGCVNASQDHLCMLTKQVIFYLSKTTVQMHSFLLSAKFGWVAMNAVGPCVMASFQNGV